MFGISNCDTVKRAKAWLAQNGVGFEFHDFSKLGVERAQLETWVSELGWEVLLNKAGTTFRGLPEADKQNLDTAKAITLMLAKPSMIKRPVLDLGDRRIVGFKPEIYDKAVTGAR